MKNIYNKPPGNVHYNVQFKEGGLMERGRAENKNATTLETQKAVASPLDEHGAIELDDPSQIEHRSSQVYITQKGQMSL